MGPEGSDAFVGAGETSVGFLGHDLSVEAYCEFASTPFYELSGKMEFLLDCFRHPGGFR